MRDLPMVPIDAELVGRLIATQFPQYASLPLEPVLPGGWDNRTFRLGDDLSVRLPSAERYAPQVRKEHQWLPVLAPHLPLPIPTPLVMGAPGHGYRWSWSIYRWIEGQPAAMGGVVDSPAFARSLGSFLAALHRIDASNGPAAGNHNFHRGGALDAYDDETREALSALAGRLDVASAAQVWVAAISSKWGGQPLWVHGDVAAGNLLVKDGSLSAVIDFGSSAVGDPACDLVMAWTEFSAISRAAFRAVLPFDEDTWRRARGWALWKALITVRETNTDPQLLEKAFRTISEVIVDHRSDRLRTHFA